MGFFEKKNKKTKQDIINEIGEKKYLVVSNIIGVEHKFTLHEQVACYYLDGYLRVSNKIGTFDKMCDVVKAINHLETPTIYLDKNGDEVKDKPKVTSASKKKPTTKRKG